MAQGFTVEVVRLKGHCRWAVKAMVDGEARYRPCYYKVDAFKDLLEWENYHRNAIAEDIFRAREFCHNFDSAEELNIVELNK